MTKTNYKGFELFSDVADVALKCRNRGVVLANIAVDNMRESKLSPKGVTLVLGYFNSIPEAERKDVQEAFVQSMGERGFQLS